MDSSRKTASRLFLAMLAVIFVVAALIGVFGATLGPEGPPAALTRAAHRTLEAQEYSANITVRTSQSASASTAYGSAVNLTFPYQKTASDQPVPAVTQYLRSLIEADGVARSGSTYSYSAPASQFVQPGLSAYARSVSTAQVSVVITGGYVRSVVVAVSATPAFQYQRLVITRIGPAPAAAS